MRKYLAFWGYREDLLYKTTLTYKINLFSILIMGNFSTFYLYYLRLKTPGLVSLFLGVVLIVNFILLKFNLTYLVKNILLLVILTQIFLATFFWFETSTRINYFLFVIAPITLFVFDYSLLIDRVVVIIYNASAVVLISLSELVGNPNPLYYVNKEIVNILGTMNVLTTILIVTYIFFIYSKSLSLSLRDLKSKAITDPLTGILNRRAFFRIGNDIYKSYCEECVLILFDLDHFKRVNDTYGHPVGDRVLKLVAETISSNIRQNDLFARYGGEEFIIILRSTTREFSFNIAEKLRRSIEELTIVLDSGEELRQTISIGVVDHSNSADSFLEIVEMADKALYLAKERGRNRVEIYGRDIKNK